MELTGRPAVLVVAALGRRGMLARPLVTRAAKVLISSAVSMFRSAFKDDSALERFLST